MESDLTLVTGATGLLGSEVVKLLIDRGHTVRILRREHSKLDLLKPVVDQIDHVIGDVTDRAAVEEAVRGARYVYHVAARIGYGTRGEEKEIMRVNAQGTAIVVDAALHEGIERLTHTSSIAALGKPANPQGLITEQTEWKESPVNSIYGRSKWMAELEVYRGIAEGLDAVIVNPSLIFGTGREGENTREVLDRVRHGKLPGIPQGGNMVVDAIDVAEGHLKAMSAGRTGEKYILGSENLSWREIIQTIADVFGVDAPTRTIPPGLAIMAAGVIELAGQILGFRPLITRSNIRQSSRIYRYDNSKSKSELGCTYRSFRETVERIAADLR
ncbi:MAG: SDR family oxidoreductase [Rhodothermia bacterium]|nr:SDR family oxidoreductase [Rhodothermia bacterium]